MSEVALILGGVIVRTACKIWLADHVFAEAASDGLEDALKRKISGAIERGRVLNKLNAFQLTLAERVLDYLGHEFRDLPENEREAALRAVADTFAGARLTDAILFEGDLDPLYLERHIRASMPGMDRDLSEGARGLYARLLPEACAYVITVTTTLPAFGPNAFTELLRRDTVILDRLEEILRRLPAQRGEAGSSDVTAAFTTAYLRRAADKWDQLRLFGTDALTRRYPLSVAYLSLNVGPATSQRKDEAEPAPERRRVEDALADTGRMLIRGLAGSGKTTLLHWLAVRAALGDFPEALNTWNGLIPFFVPLRAYVSGELPGPAELVAVTGPRLPGQAPEGWAAQVLDEGRGLVLIDGVDELPAERRDEARRWLLGLIDDFPLSRYVVTSRPTGASADWLNEAEFETAALEPMSAYDIRAFVAHWHAAVRSGTADEEEKERLRECGERLQSILFQDPHLRALASTPLLCALICALHRDWQAALPRERTELYDAALTMMLGRRDSERGVAYDELRISRAEKVILLQDLAYWLIDNGWSDTEQSRAIEQIARSMRQLHRISSAPEDVFQHLLARSGLLHTPSAGRVSFVHRTFEEYLAARAIVDHDRISALVDKAHDDQWREVVAMAARHAPAARREELIRSLLHRAQAETPRYPRLLGRGTDGTGAQARVLIAALACLQAVPQLDVDLRRQMQDQTSAEIIPPQTDEHVRALASAGDFALDLLEKADHWLAEDQVVRMIEVARRVGGPRAMALIARHTRQPGPQGHSEWSEYFRSRIATAAVAAWPDFDPEDYAAQVIAPSSFAGELDITDPALLPTLTLVSRLRKLIFDSSDRMLMPSRYTENEDIAQICRLTRLTHLELRYLGPDADIAPIGELSRLNTLALNGVRAAALRHLAGLTRLESLTLGLHDAATARDMSPLLGLTRLRRLYLRGRGPHDVSSLADAGDLRILVSPESAVTGEDALGPGASLQRLP